MANGTGEDESRAVIGEPFDFSEFDGLAELDASIEDRIAFIDAISGAYAKTEATLFRYGINGANLYINDSAEPGVTATQHSSTSSTTPNSPLFPDIEWRVAMVRRRGGNVLIFANTTTVKVEAERNAYDFRSEVYAIARGAISGFDLQVELDSRDRPTGGSFGPYIHSHHPDGLAIVTDPSFALPRLISEDSFMGAQAVAHANRVTELLGNLTDATLDFPRDIS